MRRRLLLLAALCPWPLLAQAPRDSIITVTASRLSRAVADRASLYLIIEGTAETSADAIARVDTKVKTVVDALRPLGSRVKVDPAISYGVSPTPPSNGYPSPATPSTYLSRSVVRVQLERLDQVASVVAVAVGAGAASSTSLSFESSAADSVRRSRINEAIAAARLDAEAVAASLGGKLGALVNVNTSGGSFGFQGNPSINFDTRFGQQAQSPDVQINTSVTLQFRLSR